LTVSQGDWEIMDNLENKKDTTRILEGALKGFTDKKHKLNKGDRKNRKNKI